MAAGSGQTESMLVRGEHLDKLLLLAGEVIVASSNQEIAYRSLQHLASQTSGVDRDIVESAKDLAETTAIISSDLHHLVQDIRTISLKDFGFRARRLVRDSARKSGKRVRFEFEGEDTAIDKSIVERLYDPISHQLRNALDHGIENPDERGHAGKPEEGRITVRAYNTERETVIEVEDDGKGVDLERLREKGIAQGIVHPTESFEEDDALRVMCTAGVSTASAISQTSGRGVGMDVVYTMITDLGGSLGFHTELGKGSVFTFKVPLISAVNILDALVVRSGKYLLAFPINNVVASESVTQETISSTFEKGRTIKYLGSLLPLRDLSEVIDGTKAANESEDGKVSVLIVEHKNVRMAFTVQEFFSPQKLVIIPFETGFGVPGLAGSTILGGKQLGFIVDVPVMLAIAQNRRGGLGKGGRDRVDKEPEKTAAAAASEGTAAPPGQEASVPPDTAAQTVGADAAVEPPEGPDAAALDEFISELEKLVPPLNEAVFQLESNPGDPAHLNNAFRLLHTIKGNLIMIGLPRSGETVHSVESVLDRMRGGELEQTAEVMDALMDGVAYVEERVRDTKAGGLKDEPSVDLMERTAALLPAPALDEASEADVMERDWQFSSEAGYRLTMHRRRGMPLHQCFVEFNPGNQPAFLVACLIYKRFCEIGDVVATLPTLPEVEQGVMDGRFRLLLASSMDSAAVAASLSPLLKEHYGARTVDAKAFL